MSKYRILHRILFTILFAFAANSFYLIKVHIAFAIPVAVCFVGVNIAAGFMDLTIKKAWLKFCNHGTECLAIFCISLVASILFHVTLIFIVSFEWYNYLISIILCTLAHVVLFWNGIISVYCTSIQLGIKARIIGAICGPIPIAHLFALGYIIKTTRREIIEETRKDLLNEEREHLQICRTKYPILLVHGVFFRDSKKLNYWGRIPGELIRNGATLFYGEHQSALSVEKSAAELAAKIKEIIEKNNFEKLNIIAHSKGGLDCRYAISSLGIAPYIASLTTINTPHKGCGFADYLLNKIPEKVQKNISATYNAAAKKMGDTNPDFMAAVVDLTEQSCKDNELKYQIPNEIYCQSFGSVLEHAQRGKFPLNLSYPMVKNFDGENDGLVSVQSFSFDESFTLLRAQGRRGISHADMIDLNRENIQGFDVREFYVQLVSKLREKGF